MSTTVPFTSSNYAPKADANSALPFDFKSRPSVDSSSDVNFRETLARQQEAVKEQRARADERVDRQRAAAQHDAERADDRRAKAQDSRQQEAQEQRPQDNPQNREDKTSRANADQQNNREEAEPAQELKRTAVAENKSDQYQNAAEDVDTVDQKDGNGEQEAASAVSVGGSADVAAHSSAMLTVQAPAEIDETFLPLNQNAIFKGGAGQEPTLSPLIAESDVQTTGLLGVESKGVSATAVSAPQSPLAMQVANMLASGKPVVGESSLAQASTPTPSALSGTSSMLSTLSVSGEPAKAGPTIDFTKQITLDGLASGQGIEAGELDGGELLSSNKPSVTTSLTQPMANLTGSNLLSGKLNMGIAADHQAASLDKIVSELSGNTSDGAKTSALATSPPNMQNAQPMAQAKPVFPVNITFGRPEWAGMVAERSAMMAAQSISSAELQLDPPELGPLQVKVSVNQDQQASVTFVSANPNVRDALDQTANRLRDLLNEQGVDLVDVDVSDQSFNQASSEEQNFDEYGTGSGGEDAADMEADAQSSTVWVSDASRVDFYA